MGRKKKESDSPLAAAYPNVADLVQDGGYIERGWDYNTGTYARALDEGGLLWSGGEEGMTLEALLEALDEGIAQFNQEVGR
jgi:hypothetical protein